MKEQIRTILEENPGISLVEVARILGKDSQNQKSVREAYWQARTIYAEDIIRTICSNEGVWTILDSMDHMDHINTIRTICGMDHKEASAKVMDHINSMDHIHEHESVMDHKDKDHTSSMDHKDLISKNDISKNDKDLIEELPREFVYQGYKYWQGKSGAWRRRALTAPEEYWEDVEKTKAESARAIFLLGL